MLNSCRQLTNATLFSGRHLIKKPIQNVEFGVTDRILLPMHSCSKNIIDGILKTIEVGYFPRTHLFVKAMRFLKTSKPMLAPKAKKSNSASSIKESTAKTSSAPSEEHIFNIYNKYEDHKIQPDDFYPKWVHDLHLPRKTYGELAMTFLYGRGIEDASLNDYIRFCRLHTKNLIKLNNIRLKKSKRSSVKPLYWDV